MDTDRIAGLLQPFLGARGLPGATRLSAAQLQNISIYIELLLRWNARLNLTAVRNAEDVVTRHFGESLFLAAYVYPGPSRFEAAPEAAGERPHALDLGSGAGFPGLPLKIYAPGLRLTLVESNRKKAAFLAEAVRALKLSATSVVATRVEARLVEERQPDLVRQIKPPSLVTMRAVERFESTLQTAASLVRYGAAELNRARLALLIGRDQAEHVPQVVADFLWEEPVQVPESRQRVLLLGRYPRGQASEE